MQNQLVLLHNASCAYYTADAAKLAECLQKFHIKLPPSERGAAPTEAVKFSMLPVAGDVEGDSSISPTADSPRY